MSTLDRLARGVAKGEVTFGITRDLEAAVVHAIVAARAKRDAVGPRVIAAVLAGMDVVDVDIAAAMTPRAPTPHAITQEDGAPDCRRDGTPTGRLAAFGLQVGALGAAPDPSGAASVELEGPRAGLDLGSLARGAFVEHDHAPHVTAIVILGLPSQGIARDRLERFGITERRIARTLSLTKPSNRAAELGGGHRLDR